MMISLKHLNRRAGAVLVSLLLLLTLAVSASAAAVKMSVGVRFWRETGDKESMADSAVARLADIGIKRFLIASSVRAIMAQRLVRKSREGI